MGESKVIFRSNVILTLYDRVRMIKNTTKIHNVVTDVGLASIMEQLLNAPTIEVPTHMELGTGTPTATKLGAYIPDSRTALTSKIRSGVVLTMRCTFAPGVGTGNITEAGVFNIATQNTGDMYVSASFDTITKGATDSLEVAWTMTAASV